MIDDDDVDGMTYEDIYGAVLLNEEIIVTIAPEDEDKIKTGVKNYKAKRNKKAKEEGLPIDEGTLMFSSVPSSDPLFRGKLDLKIFMEQKARVPVFKLHIPEKE